MGGAELPGKRRPASVPAAGIDAARVGHHRILQPELVALVDEGRSALGEQEDGRRAGGILAAQARTDAADVVVGERPRGPGARRQLLRDAFDDVPPRGPRPRRVQRQEVEHHVELVAVPVEARDRREVAEVHLPDHRPLTRVGVHEPAEAANQLVRAALVLDADAIDRPQLGRLVGERRILSDAVDDVDAEPVDSAVQPEAEHVVHCGDDLRIGPVDVGLLRQKEVEVPLTGGLVERPCRAAERRAPVVRRPAGAPVTPVVPVPLGRRAGSARLTEPGVLVRGVVRHPVDEYADASAMRGRDEAIGVRQGPEEGIDVAVVAHVVAEVRHG